MTIEQKKNIVVDDLPDNLSALRNTLKDIYMVYPCPSALKVFNLLEHIHLPGNTCHLSDRWATNKAKRRA
jgi:hypothetical protein